MKREIGTLASKANAAPETGSEKAGPNATVLRAWEGARRRASLIRKPGERPELFSLNPKSRRAIRLGEGA